MTQPYPFPAADANPAEARYMDAEVVPYTDADVDDLVGCFLAAISDAKYDRSGTFRVTLDVPFDVIGDPTELMRSQGMMLVWEARKLM